MALSKWGRKTTTYTGQDYQIPQTSTLTTWTNIPADFASPGFGRHSRGLNSVEIFRTSDSKPIYCGELGVRHIESWQCVFSVCNTVNIKRCKSKSNVKCRALNVHSDESTYKIGLNVELLEFNSIFKFLTTLGLFIPVF